MKNLSQLIALTLFLFFSVALQAQSPQSCTPAERKACQKICAGAAQAGIANYIPAITPSPTAQNVSYTADVEASAAAPTKQAGCKPAKIVCIPDRCPPGCKPTSCAPAKIKL